MKQLTLFAVSMILLSMVVPPVIADQHAPLRWVGCGISKKAYMVALAEAYEKKTGVKIDLEGGGATRGIREVAASTADIGGSCRRRIFGAEAERSVTQVPVAWDALVVIVNKNNPV
jgi:phosphate transport system substrate-binding protein